MLVKFSREPEQVATGGSLFDEGSGPLMTVTRKPTHPGEILLEDVLKPLGLTMTLAARDLGINRRTLSAILNGRSSLTYEMAIRIAQATGTSPESWLNMQTKLDL